MFKTKLKIKCLQSIAMNRRALSHFVASSLVVAASGYSPLYASNGEWLAVDLNTTERNSNEIESRNVSQKYFEDDVAQLATTTQSIRSLMAHTGKDHYERLADALIASEEIGAEEWLAKIPKTKFIDANVVAPATTCQLNADESRVTCGKLSVDTGTAHVAPENQSYNQLVMDQVQRASTPDVVHHQNSEKSSDKTNEVAHQEPINLMTRKDGLVTVKGGKIVFASDRQTKKIILDEKLQSVRTSLFVRDPAIVYWDEKSNTLVSKKTGETEVFVVTPGRISIIEAKVNGAETIQHQNLASANIPLEKRGAKGVEIPSSLVSLDGLDFAASKSKMSASLGADVHAAPDLTVSEEVAKVGQRGLNSGEQFVRAKAKASFENIKIKIVDDRSTLTGANYPVGGVRVKIAGTDFSEQTNHIGVVEVRDVPVGSRLLLEISDERGYIMPQIAEIVADREGIARSVVQTVIARRFSSLDFAARSSGITQNMQKSSFCGAVSKGAMGADGVRISLDAHAIGPIYFNHLGLVDLRMGATGTNGRFCFFNVDPGPIAMAFNTANREQLAGVVGLFPGRHTEEMFDLNDARHISTTLSSIATANEQLSSDVSKSMRNDVVEQADIYAVGSGQLMVPVDEGVMTTATNVLPVKGRIWTVSASPDFETSVQAISAKAPRSRQITSLVPNGFTSDMAEYAQAVHDLDFGSVVVEHGNLAGTNSDGLKMRLVDAFGRDVGDGWYFADQPVSKAIFFNVPAGVYGLVVETANGHWIASDTVVVYSESISVVKTGGQLEKVSHSNQRADVKSSEESPAL